MSDLVMSLGRRDFGDSDSVQATQAKLSIVLACRDIERLCLTDDLDRKSSACSYLFLSADSAMVSRNLRDS